MTDVSKTLADLKARFADNTREQVTPQDMRDLLESISNPVAVGGVTPAFGTSVPKANDATPVRNHFSSWRNSGTLNAMLSNVYNASVAAQLMPEVAHLTNSVGWYRWSPVPSGTDSPSAYMYDPESWLVPETLNDVDYWGAIHPSNTMLRVPRGTYLWFINIWLWGGAAVGPGSFQVFADVASGPDDPVYYNSTDTVDKNYADYYTSSIEDPVLRDQVSNSGLFMVSGESGLIGPYIRYTQQTQKDIGALSFSLARVN